MSEILEILYQNSILMLYQMELKRIKSPMYYLLVLIIANNQLQGKAVTKYYDVYYPKHLINKD